jgi:hypothetical protein
MAKIKIEDPLLERATRAAQVAGYSSVEEFVAHCVENEVKRLKIADAEQQVADQLRGLGYIE